MEIETNRLFIKLLTLPQLKTWVNNIELLETELKCKYGAEPVKGNFLDIINSQIVKIENEPENLKYHSFWFIIRKEDNIVMGSMGYKNIPNETKEIEVGYGLAKNEYEHNGYMTEALQSFCKEALLDERIEIIIAETEKENIASKRVLEKCGFIKYKEEESEWWKLSKQYATPPLHITGL